DGYHAVLADCAVQKPRDFHPCAALFLGAWRRATSGKLRLFCRHVVFRLAANSRNQQGDAQKSGPKSALPPRADCPPVAARHGYPYLLRLPADLPLRAVRFFLRAPRRAFCREPGRPRSFRPMWLRPRVLATGPRTSEKISQPTPAAMRRDAIGLLRACLARIGRTSSPQARGLTPPRRSLTTVVGET